MGAGHPEGRRLLARSRRRKEAYLAKALGALDPHELEHLETAAGVLERLTRWPTTPRTARDARVGLAVHRRSTRSGHSRNFRLFFIGQAISVTGTWMQMVAAAWLVLQLTHSGVALGIDTALAFGPMLVVGPLGGLLADRHDKRRILLATQVAFGALALALWAIVASGPSSSGWSIRSRCCRAYDGDRPAHPAELLRRDGRISRPAERREPEQRRDDRDPDRGTRARRVLIAGVGMEWCFLINAVSYLAVIAALLQMRTEELRPQRAERQPGAIREGLRSSGTPASSGGRSSDVGPLRVLVLFSVLMPLFAERTFHGDAGTLGLLLAVVGIGSLGGALVMAGGPRPRRAPARLGGRGRGRGTMLVALAPTLGTALLAMLPLGVASIVFFVTANSTLQLTSRPEMRGASWRSTGSCSSGRR